MEETTTSTTGGFTDAVRSVLVEMDIDGLPAPMRIGPSGMTGVELQVSDYEFPAWTSVLAGLQITTPVRGYHSGAGSYGVQDHIHATGTINGFDVRVVTVVPAGTNPLAAATAVSR